MKIRSVSLSLAPLAVALGLVVGPPRAQDPGQDPTTDLLAQVEELEARLQEVESYLQAQAKVASQTEKAMDTAEEEGFIPGMNYPSREVLLNGLRDAAKAAQVEVPGVKVDDKKDDKKSRADGR